MFYMKFLHLWFLDSLSFGDGVTLDITAIQ